MKKSLLNPFVYILGTLAVLMVSCRENKTSLTEQRREEIRRNDSTELVSAQRMVEEAERDIARFEKLVEAYHGRFVFEKAEKYQTVGYWVLPSYKGNKERFTFFPEVEESGKLLLVSIDKQRRYSFTEVDLSNEDYESLLPKGLSEKQRKDVGECYAFATTMKLLDDARKNKEKMQLKVRFYEEKQRRMENDSTYIH